MKISMTADEHGVYRWRGIVDRDYEHKAFKIAFGVCGGICALLIIMGLMLDTELFGFMLLISLAVMGVVGGVCWLYNKVAGTRPQGYRMSEKSIDFKQRRYYAPFSFRSIRKAVVCPSRNMIELYQAVGSGAVFVPPEEFEFVRDFILQRLPDTAEVSYE